MTTPTVYQGYLPTCGIGCQVLCWLHDLHVSPCPENMWIGGCSNVVANATIRTSIKSAQSVVGSFYAKKHDGSKVVPMPMSYWLMSNQILFISVLLQATLCVCPTSTCNIKKHCVLWDHHHHHHHHHHHSSSFIIILILILILCHSVGTSLRFPWL